MYILSKISISHSEFKLLGVDFDNKLVMAKAVRGCVTDASWKLKALLRTKRFFSIKDLMVLFKSHILSFIEFRSPALLHASATVRAPLGHILDHFLDEIGISAEDALLNFNLAPLATRRDFMALGVIHRALLGQGPAQLRRFFYLDDDPGKYPTRLGVRRHRFQVQDDYYHLHKDYINRSVFGYIWVYNLLPFEPAEFPSVKAFQRKCQDILKTLARTAHPCWKNTFSPRYPRAASPLLHV